MLDYFRHFEYGTYVCKYGYLPAGTAGLKRKKSMYTVEEDLGVNIQFHAKIWVVADKVNSRPIAIKFHAHTIIMLTLSPTSQYDIPDLKVLACEKFERECPKLTYHLYGGTVAATTISAANKVVWFAVVGYIYENSNPTESGLRASIVKIWTAFPAAVKAQFEKKKWLDLIEQYPDLGADMITGVGAEAEGEQCRQGRCTHTAHAKAPRDSYGVEI